MALGDFLRQSLVAATTNTPRSQVAQREATQQLLSGIQQASTQPGFDATTDPMVQQLMAQNPVVGQQVAGGFLDLDKARQQAMFRDAFTVRQLAPTDPQAAISLLDRRIDAGSQLGGDMSDTQEIRDDLASGDGERFTRAMGELDSFIELGQRTGMLQAVPKSKAEREREMNMEQQTLDLRRAELQERMRKNMAGEFKLSAFQEKNLNQAQEGAAKAAADQRRFNALADDFSKNSEALGGGAFASWREAYKDFTGDQDAISNLRKEWNAIRTSQATANLPPGVASDKDIELALSGFPRPDANAQQVESFLRGQAKLAKANEIFNTYKSDFITRNRGTSGLLQGWNRNYQSGVLGEPVTMSDIVETSINRGMTIEEVMEQLDIE